MTDIFDKEKRSSIMSKIKSKNTIVEKIVFAALRKKKIYFQKHYKNVVGSPDIALPRKKKAVFIDGGFWHGWQLEQQKKTLSQFWIEKISRNIERDSQINQVLLLNGWNVLRVWEHEIIKKQSRDQSILRIVEFLMNDE